MKILAMYLPQFHRVKENDEWWGEGFTDWIPTRNAKPLCEGHYQPHIPLHENYYDLTEPDTMRWQAELMHNYGIDGMCIYHYYFKDGQKILEQPIEILLKNKDINMPFCFYWANESWKRSWSNVPNANAWNDDNDKAHSSNSDGLLLDQQYGDREDWIEHFNYLLDYFRDERYIKIDGKPLFLIYRTSLISCLKPMLSCFREQARLNGFPDLYVIGAYARNSSLDCLDGVMYHEPPQTISAFRGGGVGDSEYSIAYDRIIDSVLNEPVIANKKTYFSCFTGFDDTPRRGRRGNALIDSTPDKFRVFLEKTMAKNEVLGNDLTFINAWNEWGEGMHLEPDEKFQYAYLEAVKNAKESYTEYLGHEKTKVSSLFDQNFNYLQEKADKFECYVNVFNRWMELREKKISICRYLYDHNINNVAIYGFGMFGKHLLWELNRDGFKVNYLIDKQGQSVTDIITVYYPENDLPKCDAIIVTTFWIMDQVREVLGADKRIISLDDMIRSFRE